LAPKPTPFSWAVVLVVGGKSCFLLSAQLDTPARELFDGYTLLMIAASSAINATLYERLNFIRDIAPVASIVRAPNVLEVTPSFPAKTVPELIACAKVNPGKINMAAPGNRSGPHVAGELFKMMTGVVPYRGAAAALPDLLAGQVHFHINGNAYRCVIGGDCATLLPWIS
jgi:tripartite-type tricarboxylate transporter receptor subunit TctC